MAAERNLLLIVVTAVVLSVIFLFGPLMLQEAFTLLGDTIGVQK